MQFAEQDAGLALADVEPGQSVQVGRVVAAVADGHVQPQIVARRPAGPQRHFVDGEAELMQSADGALHPVAVGEAETGSLCRISHSVW